MSKSREVASRQTDRPTTEDALQIGGYIDALSAFIRGCETPMTIAIQGDWGSGKTSLMQMVEARLDRDARKDDDCLVVTFNTWQYSQFEMGEDLVLALMEHLIISVSQTDERDSYELRDLRQGLFRGLMAIAAAAGSAAVDEAAKTVPLGTQTVAAIKAGFSAGKKAADGRRDDRRFEALHRGPAATIEVMRDALERYIGLALDALSRERKDGMRLVVMIDDLDRLPPRRAVEVLEALKIFLDVERCVFVLAIDFDVVKQGVRDKFGAEFDERKAISFFDKIIQVPFHMPVQAYDIDEYLLTAMGLTPQAEWAADYVRLARAAVGTNPRSLKRLANTYGLLKTIPFDGGVCAERGQERELFATLCLQTAFPLYYRSFADDVLALLPDGTSDDRDMDAAFADLIGTHRELLRATALDGAGEDRLALWGLRSADRRGLDSFLTEFLAVFATNPEREAADDEEEPRISVDDLVTALRRSAVTGRGERGGSSDSFDFVYGWPEVSQRMRDRGANPGAVDLIGRIVGALGERMGSGGFEIGAKNGGQAMVYPLRDGSRQSTLCEFVPTTARDSTTIVVRFGKKSKHAEEELSGWRQRLAGVGISAKPSKHDGSFQVSMSRIDSLSDEQLRLLAELLAEASRAYLA